jgi:hypothetical protein
MVFDLMALDPPGASTTACRSSSAPPLGGIESLISMPVITSQWGHSDRHS